MAALPKELLIGLKAWRHPIKGIAVGDPVVVQKIADDEAARPKADRQPRPQRRLTWGQPEKRVAEA